MCSSETLVVKSQGVIFVRSRGAEGPTWEAAGEADREAEGQIGKPRGRGTEGKRRGRTEGPRGRDFSRNQANLR